MMVELVVKNGRLCIKIGDYYIKLTDRQIEVINKIKGE